MHTSKSLEQKIRQMQPLIIIGMHRSGTSLAVRLLKDLGIHMGSALSRDAEAIHFQKINRRIYNSAGSHWGSVHSLIDKMSSNKFNQRSAKMVLSVLFPKRGALNWNKGISDFFGPDLWEAVSKDCQVWWGWKDPRTSITFPIWQRVFPQARFLHILRNGIDVAVSIHRRSLKQSRKIWKRIYPLDYSPLTLDFGYCFSLWEQHINFIQENKGVIPSHQYLEVRYEDLLKNPQENLRKIAQYLKFPIEEKSLTKVCQQVNRSRLVNTEYTRSYREEIPELAAHPLMQQLGYRYPLDVYE
jgi:hypothetical protein